jgi:hypothetical protein
MPKLLFEKYIPTKQVISSTTSLLTGSWYNGLSSPNTAITSPTVDVTAIPTAFNTKDSTHLKSNHYFMYSANTSTTASRARTITLSFRFENGLAQTQTMSMNIPASQFNRIGIPLSFFTISTAGPLTVTLTGLTPSFGTLRDLFQEILPTI